MSHSKEREEKVCLNCGTGLTGRYCHQCGQENTEPKETVWGLVSHFFNDITHFDGKFFSTVKYLLIKPGFLSREYIIGRRASYLHPIRMYVFTSAFFFIVVFAVFNPERIINGSKTNEEQLKELTEASSSLKEKLATTKDSILKAAIERSIVHIDKHATVLEGTVQKEKLADSLKLIRKKLLMDSAANKIKANPALAGVKPLTDSLKANEFFYEDEEVAPGKVKVTTPKLTYKSKIAYDSVQHELPEAKQDGWFERSMNRKAILYNSKWKNDKKETLALFMEKFMHNLPQAMFVSLPVFALLLLMLYARRDVYYVDHGIFAIHLYCASFIILMIIFGFDKLRESTGWGWLKIFNILLTLGIFFYLYQAMRRFYRQGPGKTFLKFLILNFVSFIVITALVGLFFFLSFLQFS